MEAKDVEREPVWLHWGWVLPLLLGRSFVWWSEQKLGAVTHGAFSWLLSDSLYDLGHVPLPFWASLPLSGPLDLPETSDVCIFKVFKPFRRAISGEILVLGCKGFIQVRLCRCRYYITSNLYLFPSFSLSFFHQEFYVSSLLLPINAASGCSVTFP